MPRHEKTVQTLLAACVLALALLSRQHWPVVSRAAAAAATFVLATAGVIAALSVDAAFSVLAGALLLGLVAGASQCACLDITSARQASTPWPFRAGSAERGHG